MQKLKKITAAVLALMLIAALAVPTAAETVSGNPNSKSVDVKAKYAGGAVTPEVYSVDVTWGKMEFTYSVSGTREWDPDTHKYTDNTDAAWTADGNGITVVNHSNMPVNVGFSYTAVAEFNGVTGAFSVESDTLDAGIVDNADGADSVSTELTLSGSLASTVSEFTKVGSVTVSLS